MKFTFLSLKSFLIIVFSVIFDNLFKINSDSKSNDLNTTQTRKSASTKKIIECEIEQASTHQEPSELFFALTPNYFGASLLLGSSCEDRIEES